MFVGAGSTTIDGLSGRGSGEPTTGVAVREVSPLIRYALIGWAMFLTCWEPRSVKAKGSFVPM